MDYAQRLILLGSHLDSLNFSVHGNIIFKQDLILNALKRIVVQQYSRSPYSVLAPLDIDNLRLPSDILKKLDYALDSAIMKMLDDDPSLADPEKATSVKWVFIRGIVVGLAQELGLNDTIKFIENLEAGET